MPSRQSAARIAVALALALAGVLQAQGRWYPPYERGVRAVDRGQWADAIRYLEQAVAIDARPGRNKYVEGVFRADYFPFVYLAIACQRAGQTEKAQAYLERARRDPLPGDLAARLDAVQQALAQMGKAPPAPDKPVIDKPVIDKPVIGPPTLPDKPLPPPDKTVPGEKLTGGRAAAGGEPSPEESARERLRRLLADASEAFDKGRYGEAAAMANEALAIDPRNAAAAVLARRAESRVLLAEGEELAARGAYLEAEAKYVEAVARDAGNAEASARLALSRTFGERTRQARTAHERGDLGTARAALEEAARLDPRRFERTGLARLLETVIAAMGTAVPVRALSDAEAGTLRQALRALLQGDGVSAVTTLDAALKAGPDGGTGAVHMRAYLAVALATAALSSADPAESRSLSARAAVEFGRVLEARPGFALPGRLISPKVRELLRRPPSGP